MVHRLSRRDARRIAVRAQWLDRPRPGAMQDVVRRLTLLQHDLTAAVAPHADLVLWSRLGPSYDPAELVEAIAVGTLVELDGYLRPAEDLALYLDEMRRWDRRDGREDWELDRRDWLEANDDCRRDVLAKLEEEGALPASAFPDTTLIPWESTGWNNDRNVRMLLATMVARGDVAAAGRRGRATLYDLAERVYPAVEVVPHEQALRVRAERRLHALGLARARATKVPGEPHDVGEVGEQAVVDGVPGPWRVDPAYLEGGFEGRVALLSPLDRLVFDRVRMEQLFEFDYQLEMYKPAAKRRWGYFALPILDGDRLVGKLDARSDRRAGVFEVFAVHEDEPFSTRLRAAVHREIEGLAGWLGLEPVRSSG